MRCRNKLTIALIALALMNPVYANNFGRLFTSPDERRELEKLRHKKVIELKDISEPAIKKSVDVIEHDVITLNGIVYRGNGKSTAWINNTNTYDGDIQLYYIQVSKEDIGPEDVTITLPDEETRVKMKVGDYYDPDTTE